MPREREYDRGWREATEEWAQLGLRSMHAEGGEYLLDLTARRELLHAIADTLCGTLDDASAPNYVEIEVTRPNTGQRFTLTIRRRERPTPHELRQQADAKLARVVEAVETCGDRAAIIAMRTALGDI